MLEVQALKGAIALIECEQKNSCDDCYFYAYDCEKGAQEVMQVLKKMLDDRGFSYPGENVGEADT